MTLSNKQIVKCLREGTLTDEGLRLASRRFTEIDNRAEKLRAEIERLEHEVDCHSDIAKDYLEILQIVANALGVEDEPHQTWADRLLCAAKYSKPGIERSGTG